MVVVYLGVGCIGEGVVEVGYVSFLFICLGGGAVSASCFFGSSTALCLV